MLLLGYGVYVEPGAATPCSSGLDAEAQFALEIESLMEELAARRPVIVWATCDVLGLVGRRRWCDGRCSGTS